MVQALIIGSAASIVTLILGGPFIRVLEHFGIRKAISDEGPDSHLVKAGTVTMGGLLMLAVILVFTIPTNLEGHRSILLPLGVMGVMGLIGSADDLMTIQGRVRLGGHERLGLVLKTGSMIVVGLVSGLILVYSLEAESLNLPHFGAYEMGAAYVVVAIVVMTATTSATAVTDGLDGLLAGVMILAFASYGVIAFLQGQSFLATFCFTVVGALIGFLWFNAHPASVFMGEAGAMPLGAGLATVALMTGWWILLPIVGIVLVAEMLSVTIQIGSFQLTGKRPFRMAPLHHHFELAGWSEPQVVVRFWLAGAVGALLGIALALTD
jgi:phospho-N-acetylmuramoyl-pentapeptide-transferase